MEASVSFRLHKRVIQTVFQRVRYVGARSSDATLEPNSVRFRRHIFLLLALMIVFISSGCRSKEASANLHKITFSLPATDWWTAAPFIVAKNHSFFSQHGLEVEFVQVNSGLASKNAVVAGTADFGLAAGTPLAYAAATGENVIILSRYLHSTAVVGLVGPAGQIDKGVPPQPVAVVPSTISESFLYAYLAKRGKSDLIEQQKLNELVARPADIPSDLKTGSAKSGVIWEPFLSFASEIPGMAVDKGDDTFEVSLFLITRPSIATSHAASVSALLDGMRDACQYIQSHPEESRELVEKEFGFRAGFLKQTWSKVNYGIEYNPTQFTKELSREAQVGHALGHIPAINDFSRILPPINPQP
jgi:ABC-type nitrate/sulfonate/bicarbonate transport system substrate-binding protein